MKKAGYISSVKIHSITSDGIFLSVIGKDYFLSFNRVPWFKNATLSDIMNVSMYGHMAIKWNNLDVELEIDSLNHPEKYPLVIKRFPNEVI